MTDVDQLAADLEILLKGRSAADLAHDLGLKGDTAISHWRKGRKVPGPDTRSKLHDLATARRAKVAGETPTQTDPPAPRRANPPQKPPVAALAPVVADKPEPMHERELPGHATARRLSAYRKALINYERAEMELNAHADAAPRERAAILGQVTGAMNALGRVEPTAVKLLGSPEWADVVKALEETLRGYPEVAAKVRDVFKRLDAEALADIQTALGPEP